jgi:hypothetical protein
MICLQNHVLDAIHDSDLLSGRGTSMLSCYWNSSSTFFTQDGKKDSDGRLSLTKPASSLKSSGRRRLSSSSLKIYSTLALLTLIIGSVTTIKNPRLCHCGESVL